MKAAWLALVWDGADIEIIHQCRLEAHPATQLKFLFQYRGRKTIDTKRVLPLTSKSTRQSPTSPLLHHPWKQWRKQFTMTE
jgi:hypothetical protein